MGIVGKMKEFVSLKEFQVMEYGAGVLGLIQPEDGGNEPAGDPQIAPPLQEFSGQIRTCRLSRSSDYPA